MGGTKWGLESGANNYCHASREWDYGRLWHSRHNGRDRSVKVAHETMKWPSSALTHPSSLFFATDQSRRLSRCALCRHSAHVLTSRIRTLSTLRIHTKYRRYCVVPQIRLFAGFRSGLLAGLMNTVSHGTLYCVVIAMCWCIVFLGDEHDISSVVDHWQQFLHQQHILIILLPVDFSARFSENEVDIIEFWYHKWRPYGHNDSGVRAYRRRLVPSRLPASGTPDYFVSSTGC